MIMILQHKFTFFILVMSERVRFTLWVELDVATVAMFITQNVATLRNFNPLKFTC